MSDFPDADEMFIPDSVDDIGGGTAPRISIDLLYVQVEIEGGEGDSLEDIESTFDRKAEWAIETLRTLDEELDDSEQAKRGTH